MKSLLNNTTVSLILILFIGFAIYTLNSSQSGTTRVFLQNNLSQSIVHEILPDSENTGDEKIQPVFNNLDRLDDYVQDGPDDEIPDPDPGDGPPYAQDDPDGGDTIDPDDGPPPDYKPYNLTANMIAQRYVQDDGGDREPKPDPGDGPPYAQDDPDDGDTIIDPDDPPIPDFRPSKLTKDEDIDKGPKPDPGDGPPYAPDSDYSALKYAQYDQGDYRYTADPDYSNSDVPDLNDAPGLDDPALLEEVENWQESTNGADTDDVDDGPP